MVHPLSVLHVDDDTSITDLTATFLEREDDRFTLETATSADEGLAEISESPPDCVVSDYNMPGTDGVEFLQAVRENHPDLPFILYTGKGSEALASEAIASDVTDYLQKGGGSEQYELLANRIQNAVQARRESKRADRQEELMRLTEFAGDTGGFELDTKTGQLLLTDGVRELVGLPSQADLSLDEAIDLYHHEDREDIRQTIDTARRTGEQTHGTWRLQTQDGNERLVDVTFTPATTEGDTERLRGAIHDITDLHERTQDLKKERRFIQQALDTLDDLFYVLDTDGRLQRWNDRAAEVTGYTDSELDGMQATELFPEDERETVANGIGSTLADGQATVEADLRTADGERLPCEFTGTQLTDEDGTVTDLVGVGRDLTERRQREERFEALVEDSNEVIVILDAEGRVTYQSPSLERVLGRDPVEMPGEAALEYIHPDDRERVSATFEQWLDTAGTPEPVQYRARHADGSWRWMEARGNNQFDNPAIQGYVVTGRDITEQKERQQSLEEYKTIVEALTDAIYVLDDDGRFTYVNDEFVELVGYDRERILGNGASLIKDDASVDRAEAELGRLLSSDGPDTVTFEVNVEPATGEPIVSEDHMGVLPYEGDEYDGSVGILRDISDRKERERRLNRERKRYTTLFETLPNPVLHARIADRDPVVKMVNSTFEDTFAYDAETIRDEKLHDYILPNDEAEAASQLKQQVLSEGELRTEVDLETTDGVRTFRLNVSTRKTATDYREGYAVYTDITDRKEREQELETLKTQYETLAEHFPGGAVFLINSDFQYERAGGQGLRRVGLSPADVEGKKPADLWPGDIADELRQHYQAALAGTATTFEQTFDGGRYRIQTVPVRASDGTIDRVMAVSRNVTDQVADKRELERHNQRLEEFADIVSHDLRNPLGVAETYLELAAESDGRAHLQQASEAIERSQALIDDLLTLAKQGDAVEETEPVALAEMAERGWQTVETRQATLDVGEVGTVEADASRLQQLFENLYRNSLDHGGTDLNVSVGKVSAGFFVADNGPGIPEAERDEIFEVGYSTRRDGTGLGLRIVNQIATAHGWEIAVSESESGGARFEFTADERVE